MTPAQRTRPESFPPAHEGDWHRIEPEEVLAALGGDPVDGLTEADAADRLARWGPNELEDRGGRTLAAMLWEQVRSVMTLILVVAAALAAALGKAVDASAILAIVLLFVALGIVQEYRAQRAIAALRQMAAPVVQVVRGGRVREVSARELVPGDLVRLETGRVVPADCRLLDSVNLRVQEAALTGESEPVDKTVGAIDSPSLALGDRTNMLYLGTFAGFGRGTALVVATGMRTELGRVAALIQDVRHEPTLLQRRLDRLGKALAAIAVVIAAFVVATGLARGEEATLILLTGVSLAVAIVPEGLPAVLTFTLALGARRMLGRNALIRRLPAVETLGSVTVICSDKTGTLTQNRMTVTALEVAGARFALPRPPDGGGADLEGSHPEAWGRLRPLLASAALCNDSEPAGDGGPIGDPTESALVMAAARFGLSKPALEGAAPRVAEAPFDSGRKRMSTVHELAGSREAAPELAEVAGGAPFVSVTKGAADGLLGICSAVWADGARRPLDDAGRARIAADIDAMTAGGVRVLGVGARGLTSPPQEGREQDLERDLVFLGLLGMIDPPRPEARDAVATCREAGIRPIMITGDHPLTARAIAADLGIAEDGARVVTGSDLEDMSYADLRDAVLAVSVFARVSPEHKLRIVEALQDEGEVVAMTGDGVNDAPALKRADIGVAMGSGTDVAREAADIVLLDDNFATIVAAVEEGRVVYDNLRRFVGFSVSGNVGKVLTVAVPPFLGLPLLLVPVQILWSNLLTDGFLGLGMGVERAERETMRRPPYSPREGILSRGLAWQIAWIGPLIGALMVSLGYVLWEAAGGSDAAVTDAETLVIGTVVFMALALVQLARALAFRSFRDPVWRTGVTGNRVLLAMVGAALVLQLAVVYLPPLQGPFSTTSLSAPELLACTGVALVALAAMEVDKALRRSPAGPGAPPPQRGS